MGSIGTWIPLHKKPTVASALLNFEEKTNFSALWAI